MEYKQILLEEASWSKKGLFTGYASVFNTVDLHNDIVINGAFARSLTNWRQKYQRPLLLWQHNPQEAIGYCLSLAEDHYGLAICAQILTYLNRGHEAYQQIKSKKIVGLSIGYIPHKFKRALACQTRVLEEIELKEVSIVTNAANPSAQIMWVKEERNAALNMRR